LNLTQPLIGLRLETAYPFADEIVLTVTRAEAKSASAISLRIPEWCNDPSVSVDGHTEALRVVDGYLRLIEQRATGQLMTAAAWLRQYATVHPAYKHDSVLPPELVYDMIETCSQISLGKIEVPQLLGDLCNVCRSKRVATGDPEEQGPYLTGARVALKLPPQKGCQIFREFLFKHLRESHADPQHQQQFQDPCTGLPMNDALKLLEGTAASLSAQRSSSGPGGAAASTGPKAAPKDEPCGC